MKLRICPDCMNNLITEPGRPRCHACEPGAGQGGHSRMPRRAAPATAKPSRKPPPQEPDLITLDPDRLHAALNP
jgi:hypothetical protein